MAARRGLCDLTLAHLSVLSLPLLQPLPAPCRTISTSSTRTISTSSTGCFRAFALLVPPPGTDAVPLLGLRACSFTSFRSWLQCHLVMRPPLTTPLSLWHFSQFVSRPKRHEMLVCALSSPPWLHAAREQGLYSAHRCVPAPEQNLPLHNCCRVNNARMPAPSDTAPGCRVHVRPGRLLPPAFPTPSFSGRTSVTWDFAVIE